jgi:hypothetical protein
MSPVALETKYHCAVESQQRFNRQLSSAVRRWPAGNDVSAEAGECPPEASADGGQVSVVWEFVLIMTVISISIRIVLKKTTKFVQSLVDILVGKTAEEFYTRTINIYNSFQKHICQ